jgi:hypothetical protein
MTDEPAALEPEDESTRRQKIYEAALPANPDQEDKLVVLKNMVEVRRKDPRAEERYEALRDDLAKELKESGPRYLVDEDGEKYYAYAVAPEIVIANQQAIEQMVEDGELDRAEFERIYPRRLDKEALRRSIAKKRSGMTLAQVTRAVKFRPGTAYVKFDRPDEMHEEYPG